MRTLDYQAILDRVYQHFITDEQPPGSVDAHIVYHQIDKQGNYRPCAIGIFDTQQQLDNSVFTNLGCPDVEDLFCDAYPLLCEVFQVDWITKDDMLFLQQVQASHDDSAQKYELDRPCFQSEMTESLNTMAYRYELRPVAM